MQGLFAHPARRAGTDGIQSSAGRCSPITGHPDLKYNTSDGTRDCRPPAHGNPRVPSHPGILSMKPTTDASRPSGARVQKSTPSTTEGPPAGPSDQVKRR